MRKKHLPFGALPCSMEKASSCSLVRTWVKVDALPSLCQWQQEMWFTETLMNTLMWRERERERTKSNKVDIIMDIMKCNSCQN